VDTGSRQESAKNKDIELRSDSAESESALDFAQEFELSHSAKAGNLALRATSAKCRSHLWPSQMRGNMSFLALASEERAIGRKPTLRAAFAQASNEKN